MNFHAAGLMSYTLFIAFAAAMAVVIFYAMSKARVPIIWRIGAAGVILAFAGVALSRALELNFLPVGPLLLAMGLIFSFGFSFSSAGRKIATRFSFAVLIGFQAFRLPLELILHHWADIGTVPPTMTWTGQNWDVLAGILSLLTFRWADRNKKLAFATNLICSLLLLNVLRVVVMSSPLPFAWPLERPLLLVAYFPYALIVPLFVIPAFITHLVTFRKLRWRA